MKSLGPNSLSSFWEAILFIACVFLILAEIFRRGTEMQDEQALTV